MQVLWEQLGVVAKLGIGLQIGRLSPTSNPSLSRTIAPVYLSQCKIGTSRLQCAVGAWVPASNPAVVLLILVTRKICLTVVAVTYCPISTLLLIILNTNSILLQTSSPCIFDEK